MNELSITAIPKALRYIVAFSKTISADLALFVKKKLTVRVLIVFSSWFILRTIQQVRRRKKMFRFFNE